MSADHDHLIWEARQTGLPTVYLLGTMHLDSGLFPGLRDRFTKLIDRIDLLATEVDLDTMEAMAIPSHPFSIQASMRDHAYERLRSSLIKNFGFDIHTVDTVPPIFIYQFLIEKILPGTGHRPIDHYIWKLAVDQQKQRTGLETLERQMELASELDFTWQLKSLQRMARSPRRFHQMIHAMVEGYKQERLPALYRASKKQLGPYRKLMLYDRNQAMMTTMMEQIKEQTVLVAVGAAHLWGGFGLIRLLKQTGYRVSPWRY